MLMKAAIRSMVKLVREVGIQQLPTVERISLRFCKKFHNHRKHSSRIGNSSTLPIQDHRRKQCGMNAKGGMDDQEFEKYVTNLLVTLFPDSEGALVKES